MAQASDKNILIVGPSWVGDMVMAHSLVRVIKADNINTNVDILAPAWSLPIVDRMPGVRTFIEAPFTHGKLHLGRRWRLAKQLANKAYDEAIVLPNSIKSALVPWFAGIPVRTGYVGEQRYGVLNRAIRLDKKRYPTTVQRFVGLQAPALAEQFEALPLPVLQCEAEQARQTIAELSAMPIQGSRIMALCPGAEFGPAKQWPEEHYRALTLEYLQRGWAVWLLGSENDRKVCASIGADVIADYPKHFQDFSGRTSLAQVIDLISLTDIVVCNDSGLMHVAAALDRPVVGIYGSTDPGFTPPLGPKARVVRLGLDCSPCFQRTCPLGHLDCLVKLQSSTVSAEVDALLGVLE